MTVGSDELSYVSRRDPRWRRFAMRGIENDDGAWRGWVLRRSRVLCVERRGDEERESESGAETSRQIHAPLRQRGEDLRPPCVRLSRAHR